MGSDPEDHLARPWAATAMTDESDDTRNALDRLRGGDPDALADLFSEHRDRLRRMVEFRLDSRLRGRVATSDVLQEAYIDALKRLPHFQADPDVPFFVWVRTVTAQRLVEVHRQHLGAQARDAGREVSLARGGGVEASAEHMAELIGDVTSPSLAAHRSEIKARIREALDRLDPVDREVLALRHFEELSNHEVAALLGIQPAAASKRYVRAIERLRGVLEQLPGFGGG
jgi:RNA polymerase sigma-70 factor (ECF subfamily)